MPLKIDHIGIAVKDISHSKGFLERLLGSQFSEIQHVPGEEVMVSFAPHGGMNIELVQAAGEKNPKLPILPHPILSHIEKNGEGVHHISFAVKDLDAEIERIKALGMSIVANEIRDGARGRAIFVDPNHTDGMLIEFCEEEE